MDTEKLELRFINQIEQDVEEQDYNVLSELFYDLIKIDGVRKVIEEYIEQESN